MAACALRKVCWWHGLEGIRRGPRGAVPRGRQNQGGERSQKESRARDADGETTELPWARVEERELIRSQPRVVCPLGHPTQAVDIFSLEQERDGRSCSWKASSVCPACECNLSRVSPGTKDDNCSCKEFSCLVTI